MYRPLWCIFVFRKSWRVCGAVVLRKNRESLLLELSREWGSESEVLKVSLLVWILFIINLLNFSRGCFSASCGAEPARWWRFFSGALQACDVGFDIFLYF